MCLFRDYSRVATRGLSTIGLMWFISVVSV